MRSMLEINRIINILCVKRIRNVTKNYLTKYERTKIIGLRSQQIATGSPVFTDVPDGMINSIDIAKKELRERKIPFILKRNVGKNKYEYWKLEDLVC